MNNLKQYAEAIQGEMDGKRIECRRKREPGATWRYVQVPCFNFDEFEYRIAPDVVYKIVDECSTRYVTRPEVMTSAETQTQGYWVEGEL